MKELIIKRKFDALPEEIWKYWSNPDYFKKWWGPKGFSCPVADIDFRVGGKYLQAIEGPDGKRYWNTGTYREIIPFQSISLIDSFSDENGKVVPSTYYGMNGFPPELSVSINLKNVGGQTEIILSYPDVGDISEKEYKNMKTGWNQSLDKLSDALQTQ